MTERRWTISNVMDGAYDVDGPPIPRGESVEVVDVQAITTQGAVHFTPEERERLLWWLRRPVHPGPAKVLDEQILRKLEDR